jgi:hypothetical protein
MTTRWMATFGMPGVVFTFMLGGLASSAEAQLIEFSGGSLSGQVTGSGSYTTFREDTGEPFPIPGYPRSGTSGGFGLSRTFQPGSVGGSGSTSGGLGYDTFSGVLSATSVAEASFASNFDTETGVARIRFVVDVRNSFAGLNLSGRSFGWDLPDGTRVRLQERFTSATVTPGVSAFASFTMPGTEPRPFFVLDNSGQVVDPSEFGSGLPSAGSMLMPGSIYSVGRSISTNYNALDPAANGVQPRISYTLVIVPAPASLAGLGVCSLLLARRR